MKKEHYITDKQNIIDIAILNYGNADIIFDLIRSNNLNLEKSLTKGVTIILPEIEASEINKKLLAHFAENNIKIATDIHWRRYNNCGYYYYAINIDFTDDIFDEDYDYEIDYDQIIMDNLEFYTDISHRASLNSTIFIPYTIKNNNIIDVEFQVLTNGIWHSYQLYAQQEYSGFSFDYQNELDYNHNIDLTLRLKDKPETEKSFPISISYSGYTIQEVLSWHFLLSVNGTGYVTNSTIDVPVDSHPEVLISDANTSERFIFFLKVIENNNILYNDFSRYVNRISNDANLFRYEYSLIDTLREIHFIFVTPLNEEVEVAVFTFNPI